MSRARDGGRGVTPEERADVEIDVETADGSILVRVSDQETPPGLSLVASIDAWSYDPRHAEADLERLLSSLSRELEHLAVCLPDRDRSEGGRSE